MGQAIGGDEFTVVLSGLRRPDDASIVAERVLDKLAQPFQLDGNEIFVTSSVGISVYPKDGDNAETMLKHADTALYSAKRGGKNQYEFFNEAMNKAAQRRLLMDGQLRKAIEKQELSLVYQPQMELGGENIDAVEALLRWRNPQLGSVPPLDFIPLAEENGLIIPIGDWVLRTACQQMQIWLDQGIALSRIAVNVSVLQFIQKDFVKRVEEALSASGLSAQYLELEITESLLAKDVERAVTILDSLKSLGVQISIDDFGTGYSSLSYLKRFPLDRLKIDRSFVKDIMSSPNDVAIVSAVIGMATSLNLEVVAEGVENADQMGLLRNKQCNEIQGYFLSPPVSADELVNLLDKRMISNALPKAKLA